MILVSVGTIHKPFNRLIEASVSVFKNFKEKIVIQTGYSQPKIKIPNHITLVNLIPYPKMISYYQEANLIISASGEGTIMDLLQNSNYKPIFFPRLKKYNEHVNDQQLQIAKKMSQKGYGWMATNKQKLTTLIKNYHKTYLNFTQTENAKKLNNHLIGITDQLLKA